MNDPFYQSPRWRKARKMVLIRDHYLCQECKRRGLVVKGNTVHHIIERKIDPSKEYDLDNLETVCPACHNKVHPEKSGGERKVKKQGVVKFYSTNEIG